MIGIEAIGFTIGTIGKVLIGVTAYRVHSIVAKEKGIDDIVLRNMRSERAIALTGIALMILGYFLELPFKG